MVDLTKHMDRARQTLDRRNYDLAIEVCLDCQDIDPMNVEPYRILSDASKRKAQESGKKGGVSLGLRLSKDPHKLLTACVKKITKSPDMKAFLEAGQAAKVIADDGQPKMLPVAILLFNEGHALGLFDDVLLWDLANAHYSKFQVTKDAEDLQNALNVMGELERAMPSHPEATRTIKNWEAMRSISRRNEGGAASDYRSQLASDGEARRNEMMGRTIRTAEDAKEVLSFLNEDLKNNPDDKALWLKQSEVYRRVGRFDQALQGLEKAAALDPHDFSINIRQSDTEMAKRQHGIKQAAKKGESAEQIQQLRADLIDFEITTYRERAKRQPTEMQHRFNLATRLFQRGDVDGAAGEFQQSKKDPRFKRQALSYLGRCFAKKGLLDIARDQFTECIELIEDTQGDEYKDMLFNRGRINEALEDNAAAVKDFTELVQIDLGYKDAADRLAKLRSA